MLIAAIILTLVLIYLINFRDRTPPTLVESPKPFANKRVGGVFAYNDVLDPTVNNLTVNTTTGPGGGSLVRKYV